MLGTGPVEVLPADGAQPGAVLLAEERGRERERKGVARPGVEVEYAFLHVRRLEVIGPPGLGDLARVDCESRGRRFQAPHTRPDERRLETEAEREPVARGARDIDPYGDELGRHRIALAPEHERLDSHPEIQAPALPRAETQAPEIE